MQRRGGKCLDDLALFGTNLPCFHEASGSKYGWTGTVHVGLASGRRPQGYLPDLSRWARCRRVSLSKRPLILFHEGKDSLIVGAGYVIRRRRVCSEMQSIAPRLRKL